VDTRPDEGRQDYRDLRDRTKRQEDRREENLKRIVELRRMRYLHSFPNQILSDGAADAGLQA
jgi:hypothetical protein